MKWLVMIMLMVIGNAAQARPIVADLSIRAIDIDHNFAGIDILMFGARNDVGRIVIVLRGPEKDYVVRRKERIAGMWVNRKSVEFTNVNSFYAIAASGPLSEIRNAELLSQLGIGTENMELTIPEYHRGVKSEKTIKEFTQAFIRNKQEDQLYGDSTSPIFFWDETLFRTELQFPKNIEGGWYTAEVYLFNDGLLSAVQSTPIHVRKVGFEEFIHDLAHHNTWLYGVLCVVMALSAGWLANKVIGKA